MTERKPPGVSWETWIDRQIREARERGEFDDLPGTGKPLDLDRPRDDMWWVKQLMQRESLSITPPTLALRKAREDALATIAGLSSEDQVRKLISELNTRIREVNRKATTGPPSTLMPLDVEEVVRKWKDRPSDA